MTERFSPEYIKFVTESEAIQALWRKRDVRPGDYISLPTTGSIWLITRLVADGWKAMCVIADIAGEEHLLLADKRVYVRWLPTLSDLLDMLEEAGWSWNAHHIPGDEGVPTWGYTVGAIRITDFWASDWDAVENSEVESDKELAAARLLARVLEGNDV